MYNVCLLSLCFSHPAERGAKATPQPDNDGELCSTREGGRHNRRGQTTTGRMDYYDHVSVIKSFSLTQYAVTICEVVLNVALY